MGKPAVVFVGEQYGRLTVTDDLGLRQAGVSTRRRFYRCQCECGGIAEVASNNLRSGASQSCGCGKAEAGRRNGLIVKHGHTRGAKRSPSYSTWRAMKTRCLDPGSKDYPRYGGGGVTICPGWIASFEQFLADMGERPLGHTIDRIDPFGNYEPGNCRWATPFEQTHNRRRSDRAQVRRFI